VDILIFSPSNIFLSKFGLKFGGML